MPIVVKKWIYYNEQEGPAEDTQSPPTIDRLCCLPERCRPLLFEPQELTRPFSLGHLFSGVKRFDVDRLLAIWNCYGAGIGADATACTGRLINHRPKLIQTNRFFRIRAFIVTGPAEYCTDPGITMKAVDNRQTHSGIFLLNSLEAAGGADVNTLHTEITGYFFRFNQRGPGMNTGPDVKHGNRAIRAYFNTTSTADTLGRENLFGHSAWWSAACSL